METLSFAELGLSAKVMESVEASGYTTPTPIQAGAIPMAVEGRDVLGIAQTGTGKTAAFVLPLLSRLERGRARARMPRSLILAPTRELAAQVSEAFEAYGANQKFTMALLIGGVSFTEQLKKLDRGVDVLIATPGRLLDHFARGKLLLTGVEILVIDEADRMLDMGFIPDIEKICKLLPPRRQTLFFSATMPNEITRLAGQFLKDPARVEVAPPATTAKTIMQRFRFLPDGTDWVKREVLREMIRAEDDLQNAIIFCNRKRDVAILLKSLQKHGFNAGALHGDMDQSSRMATLAAFRSGEITLLAASDVAARGLDIPVVSHVFNYDMPWQSDDYVHRVGRTGRAGRKGYAAALVTADDLKIVKELEKAAGAPIEWIGEPPGDNVQATSRGRGRGRGERVQSARGRRGAAKPSGSTSGSSGRGRGGRARPSAAAGEASGGGDNRDAAATGKPSGTGNRPRRGGRVRRQGGGGSNNRQAETSTSQAAAAIAAASNQPSQNAKAAPVAEDYAAGDSTSSRGRRSRRRPSARGHGDKATPPATQTPTQVAVSVPVPVNPNSAQPQTSAETTKRAEGGKSRARRKSDDKSKSRATVEGAPSGLGDNVPAFLKRTTRV